MLSRIKDQPAVGKLIAQYDQLPRRDQQALVVLAIAIFIGILYFAVWRPAAVFMNSLRLRETMPVNCWPDAGQRTNHSAPGQCRWQ